MITITKECKCDRCELVITDKNFYHLKQETVDKSPSDQSASFYFPHTDGIAISSYAEYTGWHLCQDCLDDFKEFVSG